MAKSRVVANVEFANVEFTLRQCEAAGLDRASRILFQVRVPSVGTVC